jgi:hypothetical protein
MTTPTEPAPSQPATSPAEPDYPMVDVDPDPGMSQTIERGDQLDRETR